MAKICFSVLFLNVISHWNLSVPDLIYNLNRSVWKKNKVVFRQEAGLVLKEKKEYFAVSNFQSGI